MTTSENQRTMHRISADNPVRRRLFPAEEDESSVDNFVNNLQESTARDKIEKMKKWNFDFENEVPLEGTYTWYRVDDPNEWVGVKSDGIDSSEEPSEADKLLPIKVENEATPKVRNDSSEIKKLLIRKRKLNGLRKSVEHSVRRRIDF